MAHLRWIWHLGQAVRVVSLPAVVANSNAYKTAEQQRPVTYKPQLDQAEARRAAIAAQLQPLVDKFNADFILRFWII